MLRSSNAWITYFANFLKTFTLLHRSSSINLYILGLWKKYFIIYLLRMLLYTGHIIIKWYSSSISLLSQSLQILSVLTSFLYLPSSIFKLWNDDQILDKNFLNFGLSTFCRYVASSKVVLNYLYKDSDVWNVMPSLHSLICRSLSLCLNIGMKFLTFTDALYSQPDIVKTRLVQYSFYVWQPVRTIQLIF